MSMKFADVHAHGTCGRAREAARMWRVEEEPLPRYPESPVPDAVSEASPRASDQAPPASGDAPPQPERVTAVATATTDKSLFNWSPLIR